MPTLRGSQRPCSMPGLQPIDQTGARPGHLKEKHPQSVARYVARQLRQVGRQAQTVQIIPQQLFCFRHRVPPRVAKGKRRTASGVLSVVYATHENKKAPVRRSHNVWRCEYACEEKAPRRGPLKVPTPASSGVQAAVQYNLAAFSRCPAALRRARRSGLLIRRINTQRFVFPTPVTCKFDLSYAASLLDGFPSFAALLRWRS
jgi:hypothetical protein